MKDEAPVWICGLRLDDRFRVTEGTSRVLMVCMQEFSVDAKEAPAP